MVIKAKVISKEERIRHIQACGETIKDIAETIVNSYEYNMGYDINIHIEPRELPVLTVTQSIVSQKMIDSICK